MKKIGLLFLLVSIYASAQDKALLSKKNEIKVDVLAAITDGKLSVSYERFLEKDFSFGINARFLNGAKNQNKFEDGFKSNLSKYEINPYVRYALSKSKKSYYFAEIFASANGGDFKEINRAIDANGVGYYVIEKSKYTDFGLGGSVGYKLNIKESWMLEFLVGYGKNLTNTKKSPDVLSRVGINLGYRF